MEKLLSNPKFILTIIAIIGAAIAFVMSGEGVQGTISGNAKVDSSKNITTTTTTSSDTLSNGSVKLGNVGLIGGNLDLSKHTTTSNYNIKNEGN